MCTHKSLCFFATPPSKPTILHVSILSSFAFRNAFTIFGELPLDDIATRTSPGTARYSNCLLNISSYAKSFAIAVINAMLDERETTLGNIVLFVAVQIPFEWSHVKCSEIVADPPLPQTKTLHLL